MFVLRGIFTFKRNDMTEELRPSVLRDEARMSLRGKWNSGAVIILTYVLLLCVLYTLQELSALLSFAALLLVASVFSVGFQWVFLGVSRGDSPDIGEMFAPFGNYLRVLCTFVLTMLASGIGLALFIVPGIIVSLGLSQTFFILRDNAGISAVAAMNRSWAMMRSHKWELFLLELSFLGWGILALISVIGIFWFIPYVLTAKAIFYEKVQQCPCHLEDQEI